MMAERTARANGSGFDMRILLIVCLGAYALLLIVVGMLGLPECSVLQGLGVPALEHPFMDLRGVAAWCEAFRLGHDPAVTRTWIMIPGSPAQPNFLMNYSPLVLGFGWLGLSPVGVLYWGIISGMMFFAAVWILAGRCTLGGACLWALLIFSPDAVLVVERGNLDVLLFVLLIGALEFRGRPAIASLLILAGALLKFFPIVSLLALWSKNKWHSKIAAAIATLFFLLFLFWIRSRIVSIGGSLSGQCHSAFGCGVIADLFISVGFPTIVEGIPLHLILKLGALLLLVLSFAAGRLLSRANGVPSVTARSLDAFFLGAPVMALLFVMGNQMDYKWIFLMFMVPAALELRGDSLPVARLSLVWLFLMMVYSWWTFFSDEGSLRNALLKQTVMWGVMISGTILAGILWRERRDS